jgi:hypothetical protein
MMETEESLTTPDYYPLLSTVMGMAVSDGASRAIFGALMVSMPFWFSDDVTVLGSTSCDKGKRRMVENIERYGFFF